MKTSELMIGDLVLSPTITPKLHVCCIEDIDGNRDCVGLYDIADQDKYMIGKYARHLEPIPLTEEILKANGFHKGSYVGGYLHKDFLFRVYPVESEFPITSFVYEESPIDETIFYCHYVHELQHAFRLCGLNDLADNFKIE